MSGGLDNKILNIFVLFVPSIEETAKAAEFFRADGLIVTGNSTGDPASPQEVVIMTMTMMIVPMMMMMMVMMMIKT